VALLGAHPILHISRIRVKMDLKEIGMGLVWMDVASDGTKWRAVVNKVNGPSGTRGRGEILDYLRIIFREVNSYC